VASHLDDRVVHRLIRPTAFIVATLAFGGAWAHAVNAGGTLDVADIVERFLFGLLIVGALLYAGGVAALWGNTAVGRGLPAGHVLMFATGWTALAISLSSPVDAVSDASFAAHMLQHEVMMVIAAPLIVLGRPFEAWAWAIRSCCGRTGLRWMRWRAPRGILGALGGSLVAWILHAIALWGWHIPIFFRAALQHPGLHIVQHACFFGTALLYWSSVFGARARAPGASSIASLFTTMLHTSALGALLTFAPVALYSSVDDRRFGLSALEDQQLGGLIMWVPGGLSYLVAGLAIVARWMSRTRTPVWP
jgi:putative membrane protein